MTRAKLLQLVFAALASLLIVGCIVLLASQLENWVPLALLVGAFAALFTLAAWRIRGGK